LSASPPIAGRSKLGRHQISKRRDLDNAIGCGVGLTQATERDSAKERNIDPAISLLIGHDHRQGIGLFLQNKGSSQEWDCYKQRFAVEWLMSEEIKID
jgi:hypothetical protein